MLAGRVAKEMLLGDLEEVCSFQFLMSAVKEDTRVVLRPNGFEEILPASASFGGERKRRRGGGGAITLLLDLSAKEDVPLLLRELEHLFFKEDDDGVVKIVRA